MAEPAGSVAILGAGGHARVVAEALSLTGRHVAGHIGPAPVAAGGPLGNWLGDDTAVAGVMAGGHALALGLGFVDRPGAMRRAMLLSTLPHNALAVIVHPAAWVSAGATLAPGTVICAGAVVATETSLGAGVLVNSAAVIDHDCQIGPNTHIATGARIAGGVRVGRDTLVGAGATVRQGICIGDGAVIGAGAVVIRDVPDGATVVGNPARPIPGTADTALPHPLPGRTVT